MKVFHNPDMLRECCHMANLVPGVAIELGVFEGLSLRLIGEQLPSHRVIGVDCFQGLPEQGKRDHNRVGAFNAAEETARETVRGLPHVEIHVGLFQDVLPTLDVQQVAFAHVDCDQEASTRYVLEWLLPRMSPVGVIVCDDYSVPSCNGATDVIRSMLPGIVKHKGHGGYWVNAKPA